MGSNGKRVRSANTTTAGTVEGSADNTVLEQTAGLDEILRDRDESYSKKTKMAVDAALQDGREGKQLDPRILQLFKDFKLYRILVVAVVALGFAMLLIAMYLYSNVLIDEETQNNILLVANVVIVAGMVIAFGRARPIREDINAWYKVNAMALKETKGKHGATQADIDKIFLSRARNKHVPPTPEFRAIRRIWLALIAVATVITLIAVILAQRDMSDVTVPVVMIIISFAILVAAMLLERLKMKPLRAKWESELKEKVKQAEKSSKRSRKK